MRIEKQPLQYLWQLSAGQRCIIGLSCMVGLANVALALAFIYTSKRVIDVATGDIDGSLLPWALSTVGLLLAQLLLGAWDSWLLARMGVEGGNRVRHRLFGRLMHSRWNELEQFHTGDVVNRIEQDTASIVTLLTSTLPSALIHGVQLLAAFVFFCYLDPYLPWAVVAIVPFFLLGGRFYMRRMRRFTHEIRQSDSRIQSVIQESLQHRTVIKTLERDGESLNRLGGLQSQLRRQVMGRTRFSLMARTLIAAAFSGGYLTAFLWGAVRLSTGSISFGTMTAFLQLVGKVQRPVLDLARFIPSLVNALTAADRLLQLEQLDMEADGGRQFMDETPDVTLEDVSFAYASSPPVFLHFSCRFSAGSFVAVMGETGRGKTTLVRLLLALAAPSEGQILLNDCIPVSSATRCNFVYVPQGNTLFSGTIRDNLLMGNPSATEADMETALRTAVADFVFRFDHGLDTRLTEQGGGLSEGQAQRIAIARALLRPGNILLFDEATSALDPETEQLLMDNLRKKCRHKTVIFITHHPLLAELCDETVRL